MCNNKYNFSNDNIVMHLSNCYLSYIEIIIMMIQRLEIAFEIPASGSLWLHSTYEYSITLIYFYRMILLIGQQSGSRWSHIA